MTRAVAAAGSASGARGPGRFGLRSRSWPPARIAKLADWSSVAVALALAGVLLRHPYDEAVPVAAVAAGVLVAWIVVQDALTFTIADGAVVALGIVALALRRSGGDEALVIGLDVLLTGGVLLAFREIYFRLRGVDGLGLGDVKLAAAGGLLVGAPAFAWALLAASLLATGFVVIRRLVAIATGRAEPDGDGRLAFGVVLAPALLVVFLWQQLPVLLLAVER